MNVGPHFNSEASCAGNWRGPVFGLLLLAVVLGFLTLVIRPTNRPPKILLPQPNGYDDFVAASRILSKTAEDFSTLTAEQLKSWDATNAETWKLIQQGLLHECRVPVEFSISALTNHMVDLAGMKRIAQALRARGRLAELEQHPGDAALHYLETVQFGHQISRGGLLIDRLVSIACEAIGLAPLTAVSQSLDARQCREVVQTLQKLEATFEPPETTLENERLFTRYASDWRQRLAAFWMRESTAQVNEGFYKKVHQLLRQKRLLMIDLAACAYELEKGQRPQKTSDLVPAYLPSIPIDPTNHTPLNIVR